MENNCMLCFYSENDERSKILEGISNKTYNKCIHKNSPYFNEKVSEDMLCRLFLDEKEYFKMKDRKEKLEELKSRSIGKTNDNNMEDNIPSDVIFQLLTRIELTDNIKKILIEKNWFMGSMYNDQNKKCDSYRKDGKIYFKNYDDSVYVLDLSIFSQFLVKH
jgi:hypothetical protein